MKEITPERQAQVTKEMIEQDSMQVLGIKMALATIDHNLTEEEKMEIHELMIEDWSPELKEKVENLIGYEIDPVVKSL